MTKHILPPQTTSFVERTQEIAEISNLLMDANCRLLTLLGVGGIGKTRLAIAVAERLNFSDGVYFIPLQTVDSPENILSTVAHVLELKFREGLVKDQFLQFILGKQMLLVLDNFEQLLQGANLLADIIEAAPDVKLLLTSREPLNLRSEWLYHVTGMHFPNEGDEIIESGAIKLFAERARQVRRDFSLADERDCIARICRLVEGMPLALELAAAWVKRLSCTDIADEIERNLDFLATNWRDVPDRHRSIRAVFAHSWQLLSEAEQTVFMKLSIFRKGFTREAAQAVTGGSLFVLSNLADKSLLRLNSDGRFDIHELLRQYAEEKLASVPEVRGEVLDKLCLYYMELIGLSDSDWDLSASIRQMMRLEDENILLAWKHAVESHNCDFLQKTIIPFAQHYELSGKSRLFSQTVDVLQTADVRGNEGMALGSALSAFGISLRAEGNYEQAIRHLREGIEILATLNAPRRLYTAKAWLALTLFMKDDYRQAQAVAGEAFELAEKFEDYGAMGSAVTIIATIERMAGHYRETERLMTLSAVYFRQAGDLSTYAHRKGYVAEIAQLRGEYVRAQQIMTEALPLNIEAGSNWNIGHQYEFWGHIEHALGNYALAEQKLLESLRYAQGHGDPRRIAFALVALGDVMLGMRDYPQAQSFYQEAISCAKPASQRWQEAWALRGLGKLAHRTGDYGQAANYLEESLQLCHEIGWKYGMVQVHNVQSLLAVEQNNVENARRYLYKSLTAGLVSETPPLILETLYGVSCMARLEGELEQAVELLSLILVHAKSHADTRQAAKALLDELERELSEDRFEIALISGEENDLEIVVSHLIEEFSTQGSKCSTTAQDSLVAPLSERELEVLRLVSAGRSNREIANELYLALGTVKTHIHNICGKLTAGNRTEAVAIAREKGLL